MNPSRASKWEAGECLASSADKLTDDENDLRTAGYKQLADVLKECRLTIGDAFNKLGAHEYRLAGHRNRAQKRKKK